MSRRPLRRGVFPTIRTQGSGQFNEQDPAACDRAFDRRLGFRPRLMAYGGLGGHPTTLGDGHKFRRFGQQYDHEHRTYGDQWRSRSLREPWPTGPCNAFGTSTGPTLAETGGGPPQGSFP